MVLLKRSATALGMFVLLYVVVYFAICIIGGGIAGATAGASHPNSPDNFELGRQAGANFYRNNSHTIVLSSFGVALVAALALSFSGIFPWCKKTPRPPKLPNQGGV